MSKVKSMMYMAEKVENTSRHFGSALEYFPTYVELEGGEVVPALFTLPAITEAVQRAQQNPEDVPERENFLQRIFSPVED